MHFSGIVRAYDDRVEKGVGVIDHDQQCSFLGENTFVAYVNLRTENPKAKPNK
jgi:hypothetical protein